MIQRRGDQSHGVLDARVVFLTHYIPLYQVRVLQSIAARVRDFHILLSTPIEPNRDFAPDWSGLNVTVQDTWTVRQSWKHRGRNSSASFDDSLYVHFPYDTSRQLRSLRPDVVMSLELGARSLCAVRYCLKHPETKSVLCTYMSEHTERFRGTLRTWLRKYLIRNADALTYNGPSCQNYLRSFQVEDAKLHHFPYAADDRTLYMGPVERNEDAVRGRLLCVGQLSQRKGVVAMLDQVASYCTQRSHRQVEIVFAGDGPLRLELESRAVPNNLTLKFLGNITPDDLAVEMLRSGALIAPTLADEWMLVVNEALQAGLPVLGSIYSQAVASLLIDRQNGWQYDPANPKSLPTVLDQYFEYPADKLAAMRVAGRESVKHCTPEWAASGAIAAIDAVLDKPQLVRVPGTRSKEFQHNLEH